MTDQQEPMLDVYLQEYEKLKNEQIARIGFRDNLLYAILAIYGAVLALAWGEKGKPDALLVLPWVSFVLGWTYLINDQKITAIGHYIRYTLVEKVSELTGKADVGIEAVESTFGWEIAHRSDKYRKRRKIEQLIVDEVAFVVSGIVALIAYICRTQLSALVVQPLILSLILIELILLVILGIEMFLYADLARGR